MNLSGRVFRTLGGIVKAGHNLAPKINDDLLKPAARKVGDLLNFNVKGGIKASNFFVKHLNSFLENRDGLHSGARRAGRIVGGTFGRLDNAFRGSKKLGHDITHGFEWKGYNKALNKTLGKAFNHDFTGHRIGALLKDNPDAILFGHKATRLGVGVMATAGIVKGTADGFKELIDERRGPVYGTATNAPTNTYATMGASYANNGGATGDLVFALNNKRKSGIL